MGEKYDVWSNQFSYNIFKQKYSLDQQEDWSQTCHRVVESVCGQLLDKEDQETIYNYMLSRKFIPGGRYLYASGRPFHQVNNCFLFRAKDSRESWADIMHKSTAALMTGGGIGIDYSPLRGKGAKIHKTGGESTGPLALMHMVNEAGRYIMQGGARRSAIWAGLLWSHPDIFDFMAMKNWSESIKQVKEKDIYFPAPMEGTNISTIYDTEFFIAIENKKHLLHKHAKEVWQKNCLQAFSTAEPGMSFNFLKDNESLRNAPVAASTRVLTQDDGYQLVGDIVNKEVCVWTGKRWATTVFKKTKSNVPTVKVVLSGGRTITCDPQHEFLVERYSGKGKQRKLLSIDRIPASELKPKDICHVSLPTVGVDIVESQEGYTLGYTYGDGSFVGKQNAEITLCTSESKACSQYFDSEMISSINDSGKYTRVYLKSSDLLKGRKKQEFPKDIWQKSQSYQCSFIAGLFDSDGSYDAIQNRVRLSSKHKGFLHDVRRMLESLGVLSSIIDNGISTYGKTKTFALVINASYIDLFKSLILCKRLNIDNHTSYRKTAIKVINVVNDINQDVFCCDVGVEEHSFMAEGVIISNCTEVVSEDDSDKCNLGTVWINRFDDRDDFARCIQFATKFLMCGGIYSDVPTEKIKEVGLKNNRIGLGLGGLHEWLILRNSPYVVTDELHKWLNVYEQESDASAFITARELGVSRPKGVRAIAPTGTIGILAETTTGIEPLFCKAYKRRYLKGEVWHYEYVIDGAIKRLIDKGVDIKSVQDAYDLTFKERVKFQADVQNYVDMSISSTCNLPPWNTENNNEASLEKNSKTLLKYAKRLRGFTCYPDGARGGQPLTRVDLEEALANEGVVFEEREHECIGGVCGI